MWFQSTRRSARRWSAQGRRQKPSHNKRSRDAEVEMKRCFEGFSWKMIGDALKTIPLRHTCRYYIYIYIYRVYLTSTELAIDWLWILTDHLKQVLGINDLYTAIKANPELKKRRLPTSGLHQLPAYWDLNSHGINISQNSGTLHLDHFRFFSHLQVHGTMIRSGFSILRRQMREMMMCAYDVCILHPYKARWIILMTEECWTCFFFKILLVNTCKISQIEYSESWGYMSNPIKKRRFGNHCCWKTKIWQPFCLYKVSTYKCVHVEQFWCNHELYPKL